LVTCSLISDCAESATLEAISKPRFIGPGCMTNVFAGSNSNLDAVSPKNSDLQTVPRLDSSSFHLPKVRKSEVVKWPERITLPLRLTS